MWIALAKAALAGAVEMSDAMLMSPPRARLSSRRSLRWVAPLLALSCAGCAGRDVTEVLGAITGIDALRPDAGASPSDGSPSGGEPGLSPSDGAAAPADADVDAGAGAVRGQCGVVSTAQYAFASESRVAYGQAALDHVLIAELGAFIEGLTARAQAGERFDDGQLVALLAARLGAPPGMLADEAISLRLAGAPGRLEEHHGELSTDVDVLARLAGSDPEVEHRAWAEPAAFRGFADPNLGREPRSGFSPRSLLDACFEQLEENAQNRALGFLQTDPTRAVLPLHVMRDGRDLKVLVQSFLLGAVAFARGVDVELDEDVVERGLAASDAPGASALEQAWDRAFGRFGAAGDFDRYASAEGIAARRDGWLDTDGDCRVSLLGEVSLGAAALALPTASFAFAQDTFAQFVAGRRLLTGAQEPLSSADRARLIDLGMRAIRGWERSLAAVALHDLNQLEVQLGRALASAASYSFAEHARAWSELKGLGLAFQFNRRSPLAPASFEAFHAALGDAPTVPDTLPPRNGAALEAYRSRLGAARKLMVDAYGFDAADASAW
jgi:hypothetical protein